MDSHVGLNQYVPPDEEEEFQKLTPNLSFWKVIYLKIQIFSAYLVSQFLIIPLAPMALAHPRVHNFFELS